MMAGLWDRSLRKNRLIITFMSLEIKFGNFHHQKQIKMATKKKTTQKKTAPPKKEEAKKPEVKKAAPAKKAEPKVRKPKIKEVVDYKLNSDGEQRIMDLKKDWLNVSEGETLRADIEYVWSAEVVDLKVYFGLNHFITVEKAKKGEGFGQWNFR